MRTPLPHPDLLERIRAELAAEPSTMEKAMFGVRCFMVNDKLVVGARKNGDLLVRVPAERHDELLDQPVQMYIACGQQAQPQIGVVKDLPAQPLLPLRQDANGVAFVFPHSEPLASQTLALQFSLPPLPSAACA